MNSFNIKMDDPICLTLAADNRFTAPSYTNDHIWELHHKDRDPNLLILETNYGLRANWMRMYPIFTCDTNSVLSISEYNKPPIITSYYPNYLSLDYEPFRDIQINSEYWVPESQVVTGRFLFKNNGINPVELVFDWVCRLNPLNVGNSMGIVQHGMYIILEGKTQRLEPVCMISGGSESKNCPFPALSNTINMNPDEEYKLIWALSTTNDKRESFNFSQKYLNWTWNENIAKIKLVNIRDNLDITTDDQKLDLALSSMQKYAYKLFFPGNINLKNPSFVNNRNPDQGFSYRGDGSDYPPGWDGQSALDIFYLINVMLPGCIDYCKGIIENSIQSASDKGFVDNKPGLAGQRQGLLSLPLLATSIAMITHAQNDTKWALNLIPNLMDCIKLWFDHGHDKDLDGFPEFQHRLQVGVDDIFSSGSPACGFAVVDLPYIETQLLGSFLVNEINCLIDLCHQCDYNDDIEWLINKRDHLIKEITQCWNARFMEYRNRDYITHNSNSKKIIYNGNPARIIPINKIIDPSRRIHLFIKIKENTYKKLLVKIFGFYKNRKVIETIDSRNLYRTETGLYYATTKVFTNIEKIELSDTVDILSVYISTLDFKQNDITQFMPLWAKIPEKYRAKQIIEKQLLPNFLTNHGLTTFSKQFEEENAIRPTINIFWNILICQSLIHYGYLNEAYRIYNNLLNLHINDLRSSNSFHDIYYADDGSPAGIKNSLRGLIPPALFLKLNGIDLINENFIIIENSITNVDTLTVKYKGVTINKHVEDSIIYDRSGHSIRICESDAQSIQTSRSEGINTR